MPIKLHAYHLIISKNTLEEFYQNGCRQFKIDFRFHASEFNQEDDELISICGLTEEIFDIDLLVERGLAITKNKAGKITDSEDFVLINPAFKLSWFCGFAEIHNGFICSEHCNNEHLQLIDFITQKFNLNELNLFTQFSEYPKLIISEKSFSTLKNEAHNFWILIERELEAEFIVQKEHNEYYKNYLELNPGNPIPESTPLCYLPDLRDYPDYPFKDERDNFNPDMFYNENIKNCSEAIALLQKDEKGIFNINRKNLTAFINDYEQLYLTLFNDWNYKAYHEFRTVYFFTLEWLNIFNLAVAVDEALAAYKPINNEAILDWLDDYNRLYYCNHTFWNNNFELVDEDNHLYKINYGIEAYVQGKEITMHIAFGETYTEWTDKYRDKI